MENANGVQQLFFQHIKNNLPPHLSFVDEIAEQLGISNDSAYRRIRGEKPISLEEISKLCMAYQISLDQFLHLKSDSFLFTGKLADNNEHFFDVWLKDVFQQYSYVNSFAKKHLYFLTKDLPFISFFQIPELARFKFFLWMRTFLHYEDLKSKKFSLRNTFPEYEEMGRKIIQVSNKVPTTEIWDHECINATIRQIEFYREANVFESKDDILLLYDKLEEIVTHFERQAEAGKKFAIGETPTSQSADYHLFLNELFLGDNTIIAELDNIKMSFLNHSVLHIVATRDERFSNYAYKAMLNMIRKSTKISSEGEKSRSRFFNILRERIGKRKAHLSHSLQ
jgi:transcriptional regulator with XRE-family HTH domain